MTTLADTIDFLHNRATQDDIDAMYPALKRRQKALGDITAATVQVGIEVRLDGLSPKYLNGLAGTVETIDGTHARASVKLDKISTDRLRGRSSRFNIPDILIQYTLSGIPMACCHKL